VAAVAYPTKLLSTLTSSEKTSQQPQQQHHRRATFFAGTAPGSKQVTLSINAAEGHVLV
jgi:hypothetical protein